MKRRTFTKMVAAAPIVLPAWLAEGQTPAQEKPGPVPTRGNTGPQKKLDPTIHGILVLAESDQHVVKATLPGHPNLPTYVFSSTAGGTTEHVGHWLYRDIVRPWIEQNQPDVLKRRDEAEIQKITDELSRGLLVIMAQHQHDGIPYSDRLDDGPRIARQRKQEILDAAQKAGFEKPLDYIVSEATVRKELQTEYEARYPHRDVDEHMDSLAFEQKVRQRMGEAAEHNLAFVAHLLIHPKIRSQRLAEVLKKGPHQFVTGVAKNGEPFWITGTRGPQAQQMQLGFSSGTAPHKPIDEIVLQLPGDHHRSAAYWHGTGGEVPRKAFFITVHPDWEPMDSRIALLEALRRAPLHATVRRVGSAEQVAQIDRYIATDPLLLHQINAKHWQLDVAQPKRRRMQGVEIARS